MSNEATRVVRQPAAARSPKLKGSLGRMLQDKIREIWRFRLSYLFIAPFLVVFSLFIIIPVFTGVALSFTYFNSIEFPK